MACSFQKEESVLIDMLMRIEPSARVFTIDTGVLFPETYEVWRKVEDRYGLRVEVVDATPPNGTPWSASNCCGTPQGRRARAGAGRRRGLDHGHPARAVAHAGERRAGRMGRGARGLEVQSARRVDRPATCGAYVHEHDLPYHPLHDRGYESIGCAPCTLPGNGREGRWAGQDKTECGLHA